jgi:predicted phage-related endonuclease
MARPTSATANTGALSVGGGGERGERMPITEKQRERPRTRDEWLEARKGTAGASQVPNILGYGWQSPLYEWAVMTEKIAPFEGNEATELGHAMQPVIRRLYEKETECRAIDLGEFTIQRNPEYPHMHATLDYMISAGSGAVGNLECKNVGWRLVDHWEDGAPIYVKMQFQAQLAVAAMEWGAVAAILGGSRFVYVPMERNQRFIDWMVEKVAAFMALVQRDIPPEARGDDSDTLKRLFPKHTPGATVSLPGSLIDVAGQLEADKVERKRLDKQIADAEARIKQAIGDAETGVLPDGAAYTSKRSVIKEHVRKENVRWNLTRKKGT